MWSVWSRVFTLILILSFGGHALAQNASIRPKTNSPFSRLGLGDPVSQYFVAASGMGGLSVAINDPFHLNILNPASYAHLQSTAFELGIYAKYTQLEGKINKENIWSGNLNYIALGFPLKNSINQVLDQKRSPVSLGMSLALMPFSLVGYDVQFDLEEQQAGTTTINSLKGTGGTYRFLWGNAVKYKNISGGINLGYHFGKITNSRRVEFDSLIAAYNSEFLDEISISGFIWNIGLQYVHDFKKPTEQGVMQPSGRRIIAGVFGNKATSFTTNSSKFYQRDNFLNGELDTIVYDVEVKEKGKLPTELAIGITYEQINKFKLGVEYKMANWSEYVNEAKPENLLDSRRIALGAEYIPDITSYNTYSRRIRYRIGGFYETDPRELDGEQLIRYGFTFGLGLPIVMPRQQISFLNFAVEAGKFGLTDTLSETFIKFSLGFTLNDNSWFFKRKFN